MLYNVIRLILSCRDGVTNRHILAKEKIFSILFNLSFYLDLPYINKFNYY